MTPPLEVALETRKCTNCGLCLSSCPTFSGDEGDSPRGRVNLLRHAELADDLRARSYLDGCLECGACHDPCPTGVRVADAVRSARLARDGSVEQSVAAHTDLPERGEP